MKALYRPDISTAPPTPPMKPTRSGCTGSPSHRDARVGGELLVRADHPDLVAPFGFVDEQGHQDDEDGRTMKPEWSWVLATSLGREKLGLKGRDDMIAWLRSRRK
jgi:hypothetical protein